MKYYPNWTHSCQTNLAHAELLKVAFAIKRGSLQDLQAISQGKTGYATFFYEGNSYEILTFETQVTELSRLKDGQIAPTHHSDNRTYREIQ